MKRILTTDVVFNNLHQIACFSKNHTTMVDTENKILNDRIQFKAFDIQPRILAPLDINMTAMHLAITIVNKYSFYFCSDFIRILGISQNVIRQLPR